MIQLSRLSFMFAGIASGLLFADIAWAENWSDKTGKFQIEAEYVGVQGRNVLLRKPDGNSLTVPIDQLSPESRVQAKRLYELAKSSGSSSPPAAPPAPAPATATAPPASPAPALNFTAPTPPTIAPMAAFPENASLQETVDFIKAQVLAGHPEVFWYALPDEVRTTLDDDEFRDTLAQQLEEQSAMQDSMKQVALKLVEVLITKKEFLFNSPMTAQIPPPLLPTVQQAYDPAVGLIYEATMMFTGADTVAKMTISEYINHHGPRLGGHLQTLAKFVPPGLIDSYLDKIVVEQTGDSSGTITVPDQKAGTKTTEMAKYAGRWMPKDFAAHWEANGDTLARDLAAASAAAKPKDPEAVQKANMMAGMMVGMADGALQPMLDANTQPEFDQALMQVTAVLGMLGVGGPGGPGGPGTFGAPGGLQLNGQ
jgi:hypothetical protein